MKFDLDCFELEMETGLKGVLKDSNLRKRKF